MVAHSDTRPDQPGHRGFQALACYPNRKNRARLPSLVPFRQAFLTLLQRSAPESSPRKNSRVVPTLRLTALRARCPVLGDDDLGPNEGRYVAMTALVSSDRNRSTGTRPRLRARGPGLGKAFAKAQLSAGTPLPHQGCVFLSVNDRDKPAALEVARSFHQAGFQLVATPAPPPRPSPAAAAPSASGHSSKSTPVGRPLRPRRA